jgi:hypothetical protein
MIFETVRSYGLLTDVVAVEIIVGSCKCLK